MLDDEAAVIAEIRSYARRSDKRARHRVRVRRARRMRFEARTEDIELEELAPQEDNRKWLDKWRGKKWSFI